MKIRRFSNGDETGCEILLKDAFQWYFEIEGSRWLSSKLSADHIKEESKSGVTFVAEDDGKLIGYVHLSIADYGVGYIPTIGVSSISQGKGAGKNLLHHLEKEAKKRGLRKIWLMVTHINTGAIVFYLRNNYLIEGFLRDMTIEGYHAIIMSKHL